MTAIVEARELARRFGGLVAVKDVTMDVNEGEIFGIVGPNGAGKTTLFNLIAGTIRPSAGTLTLFGANADRLPAHKRNWMGLGRTFQTPQLFEGQTVRGNLETVRGAAERGLRGWLRLRRRTADVEAVTRLLEFIDLEPLADQPPSDLTNLEQQRLAIGMALAADARLVLLDEPSGGLIDSEVGELLGFIHRIRESGCTVMVIDHKMRLMMRLCDRIMVMDAGEELKVGTPSEVAADATVQAVYLGGTTVAATARES